MAFSEATLNAQLDPAGTSKTIQILKFVPDNNAAPVNIDVYAMPINGYRGNAKWVKLTYSNTAAQAATQLQNALI
jgi:hypothetical protein